MNTKTYNPLRNFATRMKIGDAGRAAILAEYRGVLIEISNVVGRPREAMRVKIDAIDRIVNEARRRVDV